MSRVFIVSRAKLDSTLKFKNNIAVICKKQGDYAKAESPLLEIPESRLLKLGDTHLHTLESWNNLIDLYGDWNKPEKTLQWLTKLAQIEGIEE